MDSVDEIQLNYVVLYPGTLIQFSLMVHSHLRFIIRMRLRLRFFSMGSIGIAISKMDAQFILESNGIRNRVINLMCE